MGAKRIASTVINPQNNVAHTAGANEGVSATLILKNPTDEMLPFRLLISSSIKPAETEEIWPMSIIDGLQTVEISGIAYGSGQSLFVQCDFGTFTANIMGIIANNG